MGQSSAYTTRKGADSFSNCPFQRKDPVNWISKSLQLSLFMLYWFEFAVILRSTAIKGTGGRHYGNML